MSDDSRVPDLGQMIVKIKGEPRTRKVDYYDMRERRLYPVLNDGEEILWFIGSNVPEIIQTKPE